jgi:hypothetical protein
MEQIDEMMEKSVFLVEAGSAMVFYLWKENSSQPPEHRVSWEQGCTAVTFEVGRLDGRPVCVAIEWVRLNGHLVAFWSGAGKLVDYDMIEKFFEKKGWNPRWDNNTRPATTNAMNFHHCIQHVQELAKQGVKPVALSFEFHCHKDSSH